MPSCLAAPVKGLRLRDRGEIDQSAQDPRLDHALLLVISIQSVNIDGFFCIQ